MSFQSELQFTTQTIFEQLNELKGSQIETISVDTEVTRPTFIFLHQDHPWTIFWLYELINNKKNLILTSRILPKSEFILIFADWIPCGYYIVNPTDKSMVDYFIEIKLIKERFEIPFIANLIEAIASENSKNQNDLLKIVSINDIPINNPVFESIFFLGKSVNIF